MMIGDINRVSLLPKPKTVLFPFENVQLGWQDRKISVGSGLDNPGVICYINSTLQALFHIPAFANWLLNNEQHRKICDYKDCTVCMVCDTFMLSQKYTGSSFKPSIITNHISLICKHLSIYRQEDAHEFLRYLIESMERCYLSVLGHTAISLDSYSKETTPINQIFGGYIRTEVTCRKCAYISTSFQHFQDLNLDIWQSDSVKDALDNYFVKEPFYESYICAICCREVAADKKFFIERAPNVLCIQLKRYSVEMSGFIGNKNSKAIKINEKLDLSNYISDYHEFKTDVQPSRYHLVSMIIHYGTSLNSGHYAALGLASSGSYYYFNDSNVYQTNFKNYSTSNDSYIIFYELEKLRHTNNTNIENKMSTITSSLSGNPTNEFFSGKVSNGISKPFNVMNSIKNINCEDKKSMHGKWDFDLKLLKQEPKQEKSLTKIFWNSSSEKFELPANKINHSELLYTNNELNDVKPLTIYNYLSTSIDSDKNGYIQSSTLCGKDDNTHVLDKKVKYSIDQKALGTKLLEMIPKYDPSDNYQVTKRISIKKRLILKPKNNDYISKQDKEIVSLGKANSDITKPLNGMKNIRKNNTKQFLPKKEGRQVYNHWESNIKLLKQGLQNTEILANNKTNCNRLLCIDNELNCVKPLTIYDSLVPCIDSYKYGSDVNYNLLLGKDNVTPLMVERVKYLTDQKVPDKKPLVVIPKDSPSEQDIKQMPSKNYLVLKLQNYESLLSEREKPILSSKRCPVLKPKNEEPLEVETGPESVKKCLVNITKYECQSNTPKVSQPIDGNDFEKGNYCEKEILEFDKIKSRIKLDYSYFGMKSPINCKMNRNGSNQNKVWRKLSNEKNCKHSNGTKNCTKFTNNLLINNNSKSNGNNFKENMKSKIHLGFGEDVKILNEEKSLVDQEVELYKNNGVKRSFKDEYNQDFKRGVAKKKKFDKNYHPKENGTDAVQLLNNLLKQFNDKIEQEIKLTPE